MAIRLIQVHRGVQGGGKSKGMAAVPSLRSTASGLGVR